MSLNSDRQGMVPLTDGAGGWQNPTRAPNCTMTERKAQLEAALVANAAILVHAEHLIAAYVAPELNRDGPQQREAEKLTSIALGA